MVRVSAHGVRADHYLLNQPRRQRSTRRESMARLCDPRGTPVQSQFADWGSGMDGWDGQPTDCALATTVYEIRHGWERRIVVGVVLVGAEGAWRGDDWRRDRAMARVCGQRCQRCHSMGWGKILRIHELSFGPTRARMMLIRIGRKKRRAGREYFNLSIE